MVLARPYPRISDAWTGCLKNDFKARHKHWTSEDGVERVGKWMFLSSITHHSLSAFPAGHKSALLGQNYGLLWGSPPTHTRRKQPSSCKSCWKRSYQAVQDCSEAVGSWQRPACDWCYNHEEAFKKMSFHGQTRQFLMDRSQLSAFTPDVQASLLFSPPMLLTAGFSRRADQSFALVIFLHSETGTALTWSSTAEQPWMATAAGRDMWLSGRNTRNELYHDW